MTNVEVEPDEPMKTELCLGLVDCGRCAAVCPGDAIPRQARCGAPLAEYRGLDSRACARYSQPHGVRASVDHFQALLRQRDATRIKAKIDSSETSLLWYNMTVLRQGAFTGCSRCLQVCPVGNDYERIQASPHRQRDLPVGLRVANFGRQRVHTELCRRLTSQQSARKMGSMLAFALDL